MKILVAIHSSIYNNFYCISKCLWSGHFNRSNTFYNWRQTIFPTVSGSFKNKNQLSRAFFDFSWFHLIWSHPFISWSPNNLRIKIMNSIILKFIVAFKYPRNRYWWYFCDLKYVCWNRNLKTIGEGCVGKN